MLYHNMKLPSQGYGSLKNTDIFRQFGASVTYISCKNVCWKSKRVIPNNISIKYHFDIIKRPNFQCCKITKTSHGRGSKTTSSKGVSTV